MTTGAKLQTLDRGIAALFLVARSEGGLKIAELAEKLALNRAIVYRLVATLADHGMVQRLANGRIVLGSGAYLLEAHSEGSIRALARPMIEALAESTNATAFLSIAHGSDCVALLTAEPRNAFINIQYRVGSRHPLTRGAVGVASPIHMPARGFAGIELATGVVALENLDLELACEAVKQAAAKLSAQLSGQA